MSDHPASQRHIASPQSYILVFLALMFLTFLTVYVATIDLGFFNTIAAMAIAIAKATLVVLFFMHLKFGPAQTKLGLTAGLLWLLVLLVFTISDFFTRHWQPVPGGWTDFIR